MDRRGKIKLAGAVPFGIGSTKPHHYLEMAGIAWRNRGNLGHAWRILRDGVCDGCALGTSGLSDWTLAPGQKHLCLVRLNLLELSTMGAFDPAVVADVSHLPRRAKELRALGRIPAPLRRRAGEAGFSPVSWHEALSDLGARLGGTDPDRMARHQQRGLLRRTKGLAPARIAEHRQRSAPLPQPFDGGDEGHAGRGRVDLLLS